jgi:hypothetical protein
MISGLAVICPEHPSKTSEDAREANISVLSNFLFMAEFNSNQDQWALSRLA